MSSKLEKPRSPHRCCSSGRLHLHATPEDMISPRSYAAIHPSRRRRFRVTNAGSPKPIQSNSTAPASDSRHHRIASGDQSERGDYPTHDFLRVHQSDNEDKGPSSHQQDDSEASSQREFHGRREPMEHIINRYRSSKRLPRLNPDQSTERPAASDRQSSIASRGVVAPERAASTPSQASSADSSDAINEIINLYNYDVNETIIHYEYPIQHSPHGHTVRKTSNIWQMYGLLLTAVVILYIFWCSLNGPEFLYIKKQRIKAFGMSELLP